MSSHSFGSRLSVVLTATVLAGAPTASERPAREILGTGTAVAGLGRVGGFAAGAHGIDDSGRVLVYGALLDGTRILLWADGGRPEIIASHRGAVDVDAPFLQTAIASRDGTHIAALSTSTDLDGPVRARTLYDLSAAPRARCSAPVIEPRMAQ